MSPRTRLSFLLFALAAACSHTDAPTTPPAIPDTPSRWVMPTAEQTSAVLVSLADVRTRVVPVLTDRTTAARLDGALSAIATAFTAGKANDAAVQIDAARGLIAAYPPASRSDDAVALSVIDLVLDRAAQLIGMPALPTAASL